MAVTIVVGAQWGDEGKGKIVDALAQQADMVIRFNGGNNAGHTVINELGEFALHLIPAGIFNSETTCIIERGVVIHPPSLVQEMKVLQERGVSLKKLIISPFAHMVMPWHIVEDRSNEGEGRIGTTLRGIGPCYQDKMGRLQALRIRDIVDKEHFTATIEEIYYRKNKDFIRKYQGEILPDFAAIRDEYLKARDYILPHINDTSLEIQRAVANNKDVILEGAQGTLLDVDYGTYPYVTASNTTSMAACFLTGVPPKEVTRIIGVVKAYNTRVGQGPFPTEMKDAEAEQLRNLGKEFGATTGRPRRCGWLDLPLLRYACKVNHLTEIALTKLDILGLLPIVRLCFRYKGIWEELGAFNFLDLAKQEPEYKELGSWGNLENCRFREELPIPTRNYLKEIETYTKIPVRLISIGGKRKEIIAL